MENVNKKSDNDHGKDMVEITINTKPYPIHRGSQRVTEIKRIGGVPAADELDEIVNGDFTHLPDDSRVTIKGGEVFASHSRTGASS